jgi:hypothetical protein
MIESPQINELAAALAKAQGEMRGAAKDSTNPHFHSQYADLASVWDACRGPLSRNGLSVVQCAGKIDGNNLLMTTILLHSSGQSITSELSLPVSKLDAQGVGSAITYARRYSLAAMVGIAADDDDGNAASEQPKETKPQATRRADNEKAQYQIMVSEVKPTREVTNNNKRFAEFVVAGNLPDGTLRESYGYAPMKEDNSWESERYTMAAANIGKRVAIFATLGKSGKWMIDNISEVANG